LKILMVSDDYLPNPGGIAAHVYELVRELALAGHQVDLIAGHSHLLAGQPVPPLPAGARLLVNRPFRRNHPGYLVNTARVYLDIRRQLARERYDLVHWHNLAWEPWGVRLAARGLPRVFTNHSSGFLRRMKTSWRRRFQMPFMLGLADTILTPSTELLEKSVEARYPRERLHYIPNGVNTDDFSPGPRDPALMRAYGLEPGDNVVVVPRRLDPKNGVDVLVRAVAEAKAALPRLKVLLVGDGEQRPELQALAGNLGVTGRVVFCGSQPRAAMTPHLRLADVAALPSRAEAVSLAGLEAMACGLPVLGSRVGGIPEFVFEGVNGRLFPVEDHRRLGEILVETFSNPASIPKMGAHARQGVTENFSWKRCADRTLEAYASTLARARREKETA
jgi:glycosyltransferase involved in cell wall biosynthesis